MKKILTVVGTRPNFVKITQFEKEFARYPDQFEFRLLHTGQHWDDNMSAVFFRQLEIRKPDYHLNVEGGRPAAQIGRIMEKLDEIFAEWQPDLVMVVGDVNSTLAAAITANKAGIKIAHVESGLRSRDREMPEEINRLLTDEIADILLVTEQSGWDNLLNEGKDASQLCFTGNSMIDTLVAFRHKIDASPVLDDLGVEAGEYVLMTMHRPSNVDTREGLDRMVATIREICSRKQLVFPIHPRTVARLRAFDMYEEFEAIEGLHLLKPLDYCGFQKLITASFAVITDSGGIQEETTFYRVPCITLRENTERPVTLDIGTNKLMSVDPVAVGAALDQIAAGDWPEGEVPHLWDGQASRRIVEHLLKVL